MSDKATVAEKKRETPKPVITYSYKKLTEQDKAKHLALMPRSTLFVHEPEKGIYSREYAILVSVDGKQHHIMQFATTEAEAAAKVKELNGDIHPVAKDPAVGVTGGDAS